MFRSLIVAVAGSLGLFPLLIVAPARDISLQSVSGTYDGDLGGGREHLILYKTGKFDQQTLDARGNVAHSNHGTWEIEDRTFGIIAFNNLYMPTGFLNRKDPASKGEFGGASVRLFDGSIVFSEDENISLRRVSR